MACISLTAYSDRLGQYVFVAVPNERGRYVRCHPCVIVNYCVQCKSAPGEPCKSRKGRYVCYDHCDRRKHKPWGDWATSGIDDPPYTNGDDLFQGEHI